MSLLPPGTYQLHNKLLFHWGVVNPHEKRAHLFIPAGTVFIVLSLAHVSSTLSVFMLIGLYRGRLITIHASRDIFDESLTRL